MRARQRHLNPRDFGAVLALDSRFIQGYSDSSSLDTWVSRVPSTAASQGNASLRPVYKTNTQGGQPSILFNGARNNTAQYFDHPVSINGNSNQTIIIIAKVLNTLNGQIFGASLALTPILLNYSVNAIWSTINSAPSVISSTISISDSYKIMTTVRGSGLQLITNGAVNYSSGSFAAYNGDNNNRRTIGGYTNALNTVDGFNGNISMIYAFNVNLTDGLRKRAEQSMAFSFKIAYS